MSMRPGLVLLALAAGLTGTLPPLEGAGAALPVETLRSVRALAAHLAGRFRDIAACHLTPEGEYLVFDRAGHSVWRVAPEGPAREIVQIGVEPGRVLLPLAFDSAPDGTFVIADAPFGVERVQAFFYAGGPAGGFTLPRRSPPRVAFGNVVLSGVGSLAYTGKSVLVSHPDTGALITEYALDGRPLRSFGELRATGHESDRDLHLALNAGMALPAGRGNGVYFVFLAGVPQFRRYADDGTLMFERHVEGVEVDPVIRTMPGTWPKRRTEAGELPIVPPTVRTAALDRSGHLWLSLASGHTYIYDAQGDKRRIVQFEAAGEHSPVDLYFTSTGTLLTAPGCYTFKP